MTENQSLHDLILLIKDGDPSVYEAFSIRIRQLLYNHLLWKYQPTLTEEDVKDAIQETIIVVFTYAYQYKGPNAEGWLYQIAHSIASKMVKANKRYDQSLDDTDDDGSGSSAVPERNSRLSDINWEGENSVENRAIRSSVMNDIKKSAKRLASDEQNILRRRYEDEDTFERIGKDIGRSKVRAKQKRDGAVAKIRSFLKLD